MKCKYSLLRAIGVGLGTTVLTNLVSFEVVYRHCGVQLWFRVHFWFNFWKSFTFSFPQVLFGYGKNGCIQLSLLVCALPYLYHWDNPNQYLLCRLPCGLLLLYAVWKQSSARASQEYSQTVGLPDCIHCLGHSNEESPGCMYFLLVFHRTGGKSTPLLLFIWQQCLEGLAEIWDPLH